MLCMNNNIDDYNQAVQLFKESYLIYNMTDIVNDILNNRKQPSNIYYSDLSTTLKDTVNSIYQYANPMLKTNALSDLTDYIYISDINSDMIGSYIRYIDKRKPYNLILKSGGILVKIMPEYIVLKKDKFVWKFNPIHYHIFKKLTPKELTIIQFQKLIQN